MILRKYVVHGSFEYVWLKTVVGVDLSQHCTKCLIGEFNKVFWKDPKELHDLVLPDKIHYMCGLSKGFAWSNNFHLAFRPKAGQTVQVNEMGIEVVIEDAERLPINAKYIIKRTGNKAFDTCRNWQFANYLQQWKNSTDKNVGKLVNIQQDLFENEV